MNDEIETSARKRVHRIETELVSFRKIIIYCDVILCSFVDKYQCLGGSYCCHLYLEDGDNRLLPNVGTSLLNYRMPHPRTTPLPLFPH